MPEPISSRVDDRSRNYSGDDDLTCHDESVASSTTSDGAHPASHGAADGAPALRSEAEGVRGPHAEAHADHGDLYAGAFALKGHDPRGIDVEMFSASAHWGEREAGVQAGMARLGGTLLGGRVSLSGEAFTAQMHGTYDNPDGSSGTSASAGATLIGGEITVRGEADSVTLGFSAGTTVGASAGVRDIDHDGRPEYCGRIDFGAGSIGACIEDRW